MQCFFRKTYFVFPPPPPPSSSHPDSSSPLCSLRVSKQGHKQFPVVLIPEEITAVFHPLILSLVSKTGQSSITTTQEEKQKPSRVISQVFGGLKEHTCYLQMCLPTGHNTEGLGGFTGTTLCFVPAGQLNALV